MHHKQSKNQKITHTSLILAFTTSRGTPEGTPCNKMREALLTIKKLMID